MSKFIQTHFFHSSTFSLSTKQKEGKLKSFLSPTFLSSHHFLSSYFSTPPTKRTLKICPKLQYRFNFIMTKFILKEKYSCTFFFLICHKEITNSWHIKFIFKFNFVFLIEETSKVQISHSHFNYQFFLKRS